MTTTFPKDLEAEGSDDVVLVSPHSWRVIRDAEERIQSANRVIDLNIIDPSVLSDPDLESTAKSQAQKLSRDHLRQRLESDHGANGFELTGDESLIGDANEVQPPANTQTEVQRFDVQGSWMGDITDNKSWLDALSTERSVRFRATATTQTQSVGTAEQTGAPVVKVDVYFFKPHVIQAPYRRL